MVNDSIAERELLLFIENDGDLNRQQHTPINKNLVTKKAKGVYDSKKAEKLFMYLVDNGAKKYAKEFGDKNQNWYDMYPVEARRQVAKELTHSFEEQEKDGDFDYLLPKKYQNVKADFDAQLQKGISVELEHTSDRRVAEKIARDHLAEIPDYYTRLNKLEKQAEKEGVFIPALGMSLSPPSRSTARRSTGRGSRRGSV